ncbi:hypothetical protein HG530_007782 [Fusarium avenaceum]|nr:hypothetical protein HG530_007782 [Fusarium avenaceum]KIL85156.1 hypothetical protein FAVG1_11585 [Fusarium avenaceum]
MHISKFFVVSGMVMAVQAFTCLNEQFGQCYFRDGNPVGKQQRCAIKCQPQVGRVNCVCPKYYPRNNKKWEYTGKHECISRPQYNGRHKCFNS